MRFNIILPQAFFKFCTVVVLLWTSTLCSFAPQTSLSTLLGPSYGPRLCIFFLFCFFRFYPMLSLHLLLPLLTLILLLVVMALLGIVLFLARSRSRVFSRRASSHAGAFPFPHALTLILCHILDLPYLRVSQLSQHSPSRVRSKPGYLCCRRPEAHELGVLEKAWLLDPRVGGGQ